MKNLVCVILFFLLAGIYIQVKASGCSNDQDCMVHACGNKVPYCRLTVAHHHKHTNITGTCHCKDCHSNGDCHCIRGHPSCSLGSCHCVGCHSDGDCHCIHGRPSCSLGSCHCVGCHSDGDCHCIHGRPSCSLGSCHCVGCHSDSDCHCTHGRPSCSQGSCHCVGCHSDSDCNCTNGRPSCSEGSCHCVADMSCIYNIDCQGYGCGSSLYPQCGNLDGHSRCLCEASSSSARHECEHSSHCSRCPEYQVGQCNNTPCTCSAEMSCIYNNDCHGYGCGSSSYPQCANLDGHSRCLCESKASSSSARHECEQSSNCTKCPEYQVGKCNNNQCTCSAEMSCIYNNDCHGYGCGSSFYPQCAYLDGNSRCLCEGMSPSNKHECQQDSDCTKCPENQVGQCNHNQCTCSAVVSCIYNNDCHGYGCGSSLYPQCANIDGHSQCLCAASSPFARHECEQSSNCTKCPEYQVGQCNNTQCTCTAEMSCIYNNDCHGYGCGSSFYPQCTNLDGHSRCLCESKASSSSARHECEQSSNCTKCPEYQVGRCNHNQCICSAEMSCIYNNDCHGYGCGSSFYPQCANLDGHSRCLCEAMSPSNKHECEQDSDCTKCPENQVGQCNLNQCTCSEVVTKTTSVPSRTVTPLPPLACHTHTDCSGHVCSSDKHPYCKFDEYSTICHCTVCTEHKHCLCPEGLIGLCHFDIEHKNYSCSCGQAPDTTTTVSKSSTSKSVQTLPASSIAASSTSNSAISPTSTSVPSTNPVTTTTSVPSPTVTPLSTLPCHTHTDCSGHVCSSDEHPYCKFDEYSTICHCTVCTEHKHCLCPEGLIGLCHFDIEHKNYSCSCGQATDTTMTVSKSSTSKSVQTLPASSIAASSTSNSTISPTSTSVPSTNSGTPCPSCDADLNCVWNETCSTSQSCMARSPDHGFQFTVHCILREDCRYMKTTSGNAEIYCCDDRECLRKFVGI